MELAWGPDEEAFRAELATFLDANAPSEARGRDFPQDDEGGGGIPDWARAWQATLFDHGWLVPGYPPELGGRDATPVQTLIYLEEMSARGLPRALHFPGYAIVAPSLLEFGTDEQKALAPAALRGDTVWCIGMSEPDAGSDLASLSTRAVLDGDQFVVNGQKVWTSYAMWAQKCFLYARTDPAAPKHKGISVLILDMDTPGIEVRPLRHITGNVDFAEVFFTDVIVPRENLIGAMNDGWRITMGSLAHERGGLWVQGVSALQFSLDSLLELARRTGQHRDPVVRRRLADAYARVASLRPRLQGLQQLRPGQLGARALVPQAGRVRAGQGALRAGHGARGRARRGGRSRRQPRRRALGAELLHQLRQHHRRRHVRDPAQHHRRAGARPPAGRRVRRVAIVGAALSDCGRVDDKTAFELHQQATARAVADAGLTKDDIDGFMSSGLGTLAPIEVGEYMGIRPSWADSTSVGGSTWEFMLEHAYAAIAAGLVDVVALAYGSTARADLKKRLRSANLSFGTRGPVQFDVPFGHTLIAKYAMVARRHMHEFGTTIEQLAEIAVSTRPTRRSTPTPTTPTRSRSTTCSGRG